MKLAELYYRRQDFANAQTQFEIIAQQNPDDTLTERALFFAAESAMSSMGEHSLDQAIVLFDQVVQKNGPLRWAARNEQAVIERKLGKPKDALALYDEVLKSDAGLSDKREALCGKGDIFFEAGATDPNSYQRAIETYDQLASDKKEPIDWRNQALFKKGLCLEKKSDRFWKTKGGRTSGANFFGITKLDLTLADCWRKIQSGNLRLLSMISSLRPETAEAKKQKRVSTIFASNIFFGRTESPVAASVYSLYAKPMEISLQRSLPGLTITA